MRKFIIWLLVVLIVFGFIYVSNNFFTAGSAQISIENYLPKEDFVVKFNKENVRYLDNLLPETFKAFTTLMSDNGYIMASKDSELIVLSVLQQEISPLDAVISQFKKLEFNTTVYWDDGFPLVDALKVNKEYFASVWRNFVFISDRKTILSDMIDSIVEKRKIDLLKNDYYFAKLWPELKGDSIIGIVYNKNVSKTFFTDNLRIPFYGFEYPFSFVMNNDKGFTIYNLPTAYSDSTISFAPIDFDNAVLEISMYRAYNLSEMLKNSGLSILISNKLGIPFKNLSMFSSFNSAEFALFDKDNFAFLLRSTPVSNEIYRNEIINSFSDKNSINFSKIEGFTLGEYHSGNSVFYTFELPDMFAVSTNKALILKFLNVHIKETSLFYYLKVDKKFNYILSLYNLNSEKLMLPFNNSFCTVEEQNLNGEIKTIIKFY